MTFLGKILVVIQVVLSVCFMIFAGAVFSFQQSWKERNEQTQQQLSATQSNLDSLREDFDRYRTETTALLKQAQDDAQRFEAQSAGLQSQLETTRQELETARLERDNQRAIAQTAGDEARARRDEAAALRLANQNLHQAHDDVLDRTRKLEDEVFTKNVAAKQLAEKHESLLNNYALLQKVIRQNNLDDDPKAYAGREEPPPSSVKAYVVNTRKGKGTAPEFVEINIGSDDGLLKGHELFVFRERETKYLGKIRIVLVEPDRAVGMVIDQAKNGIIEVGDNVSSKL
jgi:hypothetical protein